MGARSNHAIAIALALVLGLGHVQAQENSGTATTMETAGDNGPQVLRGSGMPPRAPDPATMAAARWQVAAGDELWLVEPAAGIAVACALLRTHRVGERVISCESGQLPRVVAD